MADSSNPNVTLDGARREVEIAKARLRAFRALPSPAQSPVVQGVRNHPWLAVGAGVVGLGLIGRFRLLRLAIPAIPWLIRSPAVWRLGARAVSAAVNNKRSRNQHVDAQHRLPPGSAHVSTRRGSAISTAD